MGSRGRKATEVNKELLIKCINDVEQKGPLVNRQSLYEATAELYNKQGNISSNITFSTVYLRINEWGIVVRTPKGKRGNKNLGDVANRPKGVRKTRGEKTAKFKENFDLMRAELIDHGKQALLPLVDKAEAGSIKARIILNCRRCVGYETKEVAKCTSYACPWFAVRPNALTKAEQKKTKNFDQYDVDDEDN